MQTLRPGLPRCCSTALTYPLLKCWCTDVGTMGCPTGGGLNCCLLMSNSTSHLASPAQQPTTSLFCCLSNFSLHCLRCWGPQGIELGEWNLSCPGTCHHDAFFFMHVQGQEGIFVHVTFVLLYTLGGPQVPQLDLWKETQGAIKEGPAGTLVNPRHGSQRG